MGEQEGSREILFGNKREGKDEVYVAVDSKGTVYTIHESVVKQLEKDLTALRDFLEEEKKESPAPGKTKK